MKKIFLYKKGKVKSLDIRNSSNLKNKIINNTNPIINFQIIYHLLMMELAEKI